MVMALAMTVVLQLCNYFLLVFLKVINSASFVTSSKQSLMLYGIVRIVTLGMPYTILTTFIVWEKLCQQQAHVWMLVVIGGTG